MCVQLVDRATRVRHRYPWAAVLVAMFLGWPPNVSGAQLVTPRTVPVQQSGQFDIFPSQRAGMAGVSIALDDTLLDPFVNPAKAIRLRGSLLFSDPSAHKVTEGGGEGRTLPVGMLISRGAWVGGGLVALQQLDRNAPRRLVTHDGAASNRYLSAILARRLGQGLSLGASGYWAGLDGMDGLDQLYAGSDRLDVSGKQADLRIGMLKEWADTRAFEVLLLHSRTDMSHDVRFPFRCGTRRRGLSRSSHDSSITTIAHAYGGCTRS